MLHVARKFRSLQSDTTNEPMVIQLFKFLGKTAGVIFLIGLVVVVGLLMLIF